MKERNGAKIIISTKLLLEWLQFEGGVLRSIKLDDNYLPVNTVVLVIEHPDLPTVKLGEAIETVHPQYTVHYEEGNLIGLKRTDPPKK